jgi:hypothetical protein
METDDATSLPIFGCSSPGNLVSQHWASHTATEREGILKQNPSMHLLTINMILGIYSEDQLT